MIAKSLDATTLLMDTRDTLLAEAAQDTRANEKLLQEAKAIYHANKIKINQKLKKAEVYNQAIDTEKETQVLQQREIEKQYSYKSTSQLAAMMVDDQLQP